MNGQNNRNSQQIPQNPTFPTTPQEVKTSPTIVAEIPEESQAIPQKSIVIFPTVILLIIVSAFAGYLIYQNTQLKKALKVNSFDDCAKEKGVIQESYPRICVTKDGRKFIEEIEETSIPISTPTEKPENIITLPQEN